MDSRKFQEEEEEDRSIRLQVSELQKLEEARGSNDTVFDLRSSIEKGDSGETADAASVSSATAFRRKSTIPAPEKKLTLFALQLAILEKTATGIGTLGFIWATVVLLGGFAITLDGSDFWFITIILLIEGARIFSRSHELEWQHQSTWTVAGVGISSFRALRSSSASILRNLKRTSELIFKPIVGSRSRETTTTRDCVVREPTFDDTWENSDVPLLPYARWFFISSTVSRLLYWLQLLSATACVALSAYKLVRHNYGDYKGIPKKQIQEFMAKGYDIVLRVDIQGAQTLRKILGVSAVFIFVVAESEIAMVERLIDRRTESREELLVRVATAREEIRHVKDFDYVVVNAKGKLDDSVKRVESIIDAEKSKVHQRIVRI